MQMSIFPDDRAPNALRGSRTDPLIVEEVLAEAARSRQLDGDELNSAHTIFVKWADMETSGRLGTMNESQLKPDFLTEVFGRALHYTRFAENLDTWELWPEFAVDGQSADAALGQFEASKSPSPQAMVEVKGPNSDVDRDRSGGRTAVEQCRDYMNYFPDCPWGVVTNMVSFRLYHHRHTPRQYEHFALEDLRDPRTFRRFYVLFERNGLLPSLLGQRPRAAQLLHESEHQQQRVGNAILFGPQFARRRLACN